MAIRRGNRRRRRVYAPAVLVVGHLLRDPDEQPFPGWLRIDEGRIAEVGTGAPPSGSGGDPEPRLASPSGGPGRLIVPGFVDAHIHVPQIGAIGCIHTDLLAWLDEIIFPIEAGWADPSVVVRDLHAFHRKLLGAGTLAAAASSSPHAAAMEIVRRADPTAAVRLLVGQSLMDRNAPEALIRQRPWNPPPHDEAASSDASGRLEFSINPRFAPSCSSELLAEAAKLAGADRFIQTHLAESALECAWVRKLFPDDASYVDVYDHHALLSPKTLLAHGVHLAPSEWETIARRGSVVVHCPQANLFLRSGLFDLKAARDHGVRLALGSDVAAGSDLAMPRVARSMIEVALVRSMTVDASAAIPTPAEAWRMITCGNAEALGFDDMGRLEVGASADLLVLRPDVEFDRDLIGRLIFGWRDEWIETRIVGGVAS